MSVSAFFLFCCSDNWEHSGLRAASSLGTFSSFLFSPKCFQVSCIYLCFSFSFYLCSLHEWGKKIVFNNSKMAEWNDGLLFPKGILESD